MKTPFALLALICLADVATAQGKEGPGWTNPELKATRIAQQRYDAAFRAHFEKCTDSSKEVAYPILVSGEARCGRNGPAEYAAACSNRRERTATVYREALIACMFDKGWMPLPPVE